MLQNYNSRKHNFKKKASRTSASLPDGASSNCPLQIKNGQAFILEVGWMYAPNQRQRMIRSYDQKGGWVSLTLVTESKVAASNTLK